MSDKKPVKVQRTKTVDRLAELLAEKKRKRQQLAKQAEMRRQASERRKEEHNQIMASSQNFGTYAEFPSDRSENPNAYTPNMAAVPPEVRKKHKSVNMRGSNPELIPPPMGPPGEPQHKPKKRRGSAESVGSIGRTLSRSVSRSQLGRTVTRSAQAAGEAAQIAALQAAIVLRANQEHMRNNAEIRRQHMLKRQQQMNLLQAVPSERNMQLDQKKASKQPNKQTPNKQAPPTKEAPKVGDKDHLVAQLEKRVNGHAPWFARTITLIQLLVIGAMMYTGETASWGMGIEVTDHEVDLLVGTTMQTVQRPENPYYGPHVETLLSWGSKWSACMREDIIVDEIVENMVDEEAGYGCCVVSAGGDCGMMSEANCLGMGTFSGAGVTCSSLGATCANIKLRPCCFSVYGQCAVVAENHCESLGGIFHDTAETCGEVNCLDEVCGMYSFAKDNYESPNQFYRFVTAIFLHVGVIHFVMNALGQYVMVGQVEFVAGFWRTAAMYVISGACGFMISALFSADTLSNGSSAAIYGMLGVETVDLFQTWQLLENKSKQLMGLLFKLVIFLGIGTLPYIDNFAHVGGFFAGLVTGIVFLPYLVFGTMDSYRKRLLQVLCSVALLALVVGLLYKFYSDREIACSWCHYVNCVPYTSTMCAAADETTAE